MTQDHSQVSGNSTQTLGCGCCCFGRLGALKQGVVTVVQMAFAVGTGEANDI